MTKGLLRMKGLVSFDEKDKGMYLKLYLSHNL